MLELKDDGRRAEDLGAKLVTLLEVVDILVCLVQGE